MARLYHFFGIQIAQSREYLQTLGPNVGLIWLLGLLRFFCLYISHDTRSLIDLWQIINCLEAREVPPAGSDDDDED